MPRRRLHVLAGLLAVLGCEGEPAAPVQVPETCELDRGVLLVPRTSDWHLDDASTPIRFLVMDDLLLYQLGDPAQFGADAFIRGLCDDQPEHVLAAEHGLRYAFVASNEAGRTLFALDAEDRLYAVDRLEEPGADPPRALKGLPGGVLGVPQASYAIQGDLLFVERQGQPEVQPQGAAGLGAVREAVWAYTGKPEDDPVYLGGDLVRHIGMWSDEVLVHGDDGRVRWIDRRTASERPVRDGVRAMTYVNETILLVQVLGDGVAEEVLLLSLMSGQESPFTTNVHAGSSFGLDPTQPDIGTWFTQPALALIGPGGALTEVYRNDNYEPIAVPAHVGLSDVVSGDYFNLVLPDPVDHVLALWDPRTGEFFEWYRGAVPEPDAMLNPKWANGVMRFEAVNPDGSHQLIELDVATGERRVLVSPLGTRIKTLADGRIVHALGPGNPLGAQIVLSSPYTNTADVVLAEHAFRYDVFEMQNALLVVDASGLRSVSL